METSLLPPGSAGISCRSPGTANPTVLRESGPALGPASALLILALASAAAAEPGGARWPGWRGDGSGGSAEQNLPVAWNAELNVAWKAPLPPDEPYPCNSSPVIWDGRIFLTSSAEEGKRRSVVCLDAATGLVVWQSDFAAGRVEKTELKNGYASPTCATDGERVVAFFDSPGLVALDLEGRHLWTLDLGPFQTDWGMAASPLIHDDLVIMVCDHDEGSFIVGVDKVKGEVRWRTERTATGRQYATPLAITVAGEPQIVVNGGTVAAYDPRSGREIWTCRGMIKGVTPSAVHADGLVYAVSGRNGPAMAIDPGGRGDVTDSHVRMHVPVGGPYVPSPLLCPLLLLPGDNGTFRFIDAGGKVAAQGRVRGHFASSPVFGAGKVYWASEQGDVHVIDVSACHGPGAAVRVLASNPLGERILATPAIANGRLYVRSDRHLFCITAGAGPPVPVVEEREMDFAALAAAFRAHPARVGPDAAVRVEIVETLGRIRDPEAIPFLVDAALRDKHWDVSEAAAKSLGGHDQAAVPALIGLIENGDWRPYLKVIAADHLGRLQAAAAVPALLLAARGHEDPLVRIACLRALARIAAVEGADAAAPVDALVAALDEPQGVVKRAAIELLAELADRIGDRKRAVIAGLQDLAADPNPLVANAAAAALATAFGAEEGGGQEGIRSGE